MGVGSCPIDWRRPAVLRAACSGTDIITMICEIKIGQVGGGVIWLPPKTAAPQAPDLPERHGERAGAGSGRPAHVVAGIVGRLCAGVATCRGWQAAKSGAAVARCVVICV